MNASHDIGDSRTGTRVLDTFIDAISWEDAMHTIDRWVKSRESRYVCLCNVHSVVTATRDEVFRDVLERADMATADGIPVTWAMRGLGFSAQERISGPDLMWKYCEIAGQEGRSVYFYGNTQQTLDALSDRMKREFPHLHVAGTYSPPFRALTQREDDEVVARINASGAAVVFISLGCPKQELWMAQHRDRIRAVMIGVGAAFDFHAGVVKRARPWMRRFGLEWLYRLYCEPRRLWKRYLVTNTLFIAGAIRQLLRARWMLWNKPIR